jgi:SHS2 domain-containing protein
MPYVFVPHTGDLAVQVEAATLPGLCADAVGALAAAITDPALIRLAEARTVHVDAPDEERLLHDLLSEVHYLFDAGRWLTGRADVALTGGADAWHLDARLWGEPYDAGRHPVRAVVKAVTYHQLAIVHGEAGWRTMVVFDL